MTRRPLGCMTFTALAAAVITLLVIAGAILATGNAVFSPGALSGLTQPDGAQVASVGGVTSHAQLEGRCDACHAPIWSGQRMGDRCLACHADVATQAASGTGLHGKLDATAATCLRCHTDHRGATASATLADPSVFPHDQTGFALTAHLQPAAATAVGCRGCHPTSPKDYKAPACLGCHQQLDAAKMATHTDTYGAQCLNCHDGKDTYGHAFAHTSYALTGKHAVADCAGCHKGSTTVAALQATSTACISCHAKDDIHEGRLGQSCATCHTPDGWTGAQLDHTKQTTFPLAGKHAGTACESCHVNRQWTGLATTCVACHAKDDAHGGKFGTDCASCHNPSDWKQATFDHATTGFALTQAHASVGCAKCHQNDRFAGTPTNCAGCHASVDKHKGALGSKCETCHKPTQWSAASFNHSSTSFKLTGKHAGVGCEQCHTSGPPQNTSTACASCHARPASHDSHFGANCATCHSTKAWKPAAFNHSVTSYKLTGAHASTTCLKCHHSPSKTFAGAPKTCASCHAKPANHTGAMASGCGTCHSTKAWSPSTFNHNNTTFKLTGAHTSLLCQKCHTKSSFGGLPTTCAACHSKPASHPGFYGTVCTKCHSTSSWTRISYRGAHTFPMNHRGAGGICTKCHTTSLQSYTCAKCHNPSRIEEHAGRSSSTCASCHPTGAGGG
jgi:hypothetical protein